MARRRLPIGIQTFREVREQDCYYVDKTGYIERLLDEGKHYFLYDITVEESSSHGRLDMAVRAAGHVYLFEFKVAEMAPPGSALAQLRRRRYADKYRAAGQPIHLVGVEFSRATRNITAFDTADA